MNDSFNILFKQLMCEGVQFWNRSNKDFIPIKQLLVGEEGTIVYYANKLFFNYKKMLTPEEIINYAKQMANLLYDYLEKKIQSGEIDEFIYRETSYPNQTHKGKYISIDKQNPQWWLLIYEHPHEWNPNKLKQSKIPVPRILPLSFQKIEKDFTAPLQNQYKEYSKKLYEKQEAERKERERKRTEIDPRIKDFVKNNFYNFVNQMPQHYISKNYILPKEISNKFNTLSSEEKQLFYDYVQNYIYSDPYLEYIDGPDYFTEKSKLKTLNNKKDNLKQQLALLLNKK